MEVVGHGILRQPIMYVCTFVYLPGDGNVQMKIYDRLPYADSTGHRLCSWGRVYDFEKYGRGIV
jgi:hypothetical protein